MKEEIWAAIDKIEDEYLIDDNYVRYPATLHEFQTAADKLMIIWKGCDAFQRAEILDIKDYNEILNTVDLEDYVYSESSNERENGMGPDFVRYFDSEQSYECPDCGNVIRISGWKREYPMGAFDSENVDISLVDEDDE